MKSIKWFLVALFSFAGTCVALAQSSLPKLEPAMARELFGVYAGCKAYWKFAVQCLPPGLEPKDYARVRKSFDQLQSVGTEHMKWLATKAQLSPGMQQQISEKSSSRVLEAAAGKCEAAPTLLTEYRDKCAALFQNVASVQKEVPSSKLPTEAENAKSASNLIVSTCYEPIDDISRVSSYAAMKKWRAISADQKRILKPVDSTFFDAWEVDYDGLTYIVSVNRGHFKGRPTEVCQVSGSQRSNMITAQILEAIKARSIGTNSVGLQTSEIFELVSHPSVKTAVMIVSRDPQDSAFFTIAFMGVK